MTDRNDEAGASEYQAAPDAHVDERTGARVPTPDPKDQTGDPEQDNGDAGNPAMRELRKRQNKGDITES
jgi:hypothetical protein